MKAYINNHTIEYIIDAKYTTCCIKNSFLITNKQIMEIFIRTILRGDMFNESPFDKRSIKSYIREWRAHNLLYKWHFKVSKTKDTDLNIYESKRRRLCYFFLSLLYIGK